MIHKRELSSNGGTVLFVGTKKQAGDSIREEAERAGAYYVNARWLGGCLLYTSMLFDQYAWIDSLVARVRAAYGR